MPKSVCRIVAVPRYRPGPGLVTWSWMPRETPCRVRVPSIAPLPASPPTTRTTRMTRVEVKPARAGAAEDLARLVLDVPAVPVAERLGAAGALADRQRAQVEVGGHRGLTGDRRPRRRGLPAPASR